MVEKLILEKTNSQEIVAQFLVNPAFILLNYNNVEKLLSPFNSTDDIRLEVEEFLKINKSRILQQVNFLKSERKKYVFNHLKLIRLYLGDHVLSRFFNQHLEKVNKHSIALQSLLHEVSHFLNFLTLQKKLDPVIHQLIDFYSVKVDLKLRFEDGGWSKVLSYYIDKTEVDNLGERYSISPLIAAKRLPKGLLSLEQDLKNNEKFDFDHELGNFCFSIDYNTGDVNFNILSAEESNLLSWITTRIDFSIEELNNMSFFKESFRWLFNNELIVRTRKNSFGK